NQTLPAASISTLPYSSFPFSPNQTLTAALIPFLPFPSFPFSPNQILPLCSPFPQPNSAATHSGLVWRSPGKNGEARFSVSNDGLSSIDGGLWLISSRSGRVQWRRRW
ncbi:hypothetical protein Tsubulata_043035, partial [Turnera subulata]